MLVYWKLTGAELAVLFWIINYLYLWRVYTCKINLFPKSVSQMIHIIKYSTFNSLRPSDAYMRQYTNHHWFRQWLVAWSAPSHYLNQWWNIVNLTPRNKFQWNVNQNSYIVIEENAFENVVWKMASIFLGLNELIGNKYNSHSSDSCEPGSQLLSHSTLLSQVSLGKWPHDLHYNLGCHCCAVCKVIQEYF